MSDFDKIINDRLNEEDGEFFPHRDVNWDKLTERLEAFETANPLPNQAPQPVMRAVWVRRAITSAAAALIGVSGLLIWHFNDMNSVQRENARLQQEIADLKSYQQTLQSNASVDTKVIGQNGENLNQSNGALSQQEVTNTPNIVTNTQHIDPSVSSINSEQKEAKTSENKQNAAILDNKTGVDKKEIRKKEGIKVQKRNDSQLADMNNKKALDAVPFDKNNQPLQKQKAQLKQSGLSLNDPSVSTSVLEGNKGVFVENKQKETNLSPKTNDAQIETDRKEIDKIESLTQNAATQNASTNIAPPTTENKEDLEKANTDALAIEKTKEAAIINANIAQQEEKSNTESVAAAPPIIKTDKNIKKFLPKGLAVGIHGTYASVLPEIPGLNPTEGKGISLDLMLTKNMGIVVNGDIIERHFEMRERPKHFRLPDAPDPHKPNVGLHRIKGEEHSKMLSVNAKYVISEKWWIQPFVTLGHSWLKTDEHAVNFVFKDQTTNEETTSQTTVAAQKNKNLWQAGVGFEKRIKRWSFGISAEMQKDFSAPTDPNGKTVASNFGILRGGVKFNVF